MKRKIYFFLVVFVFLSILIFPLAIKIKVACLSQYGVCSDNLYNDLGKYNGKNLFIANMGIVKFLKSNFLISQFSTQFKLPNILAVNVLIKKPVFALSDGKSIDLVDNEGTVLSYANNTQLPRVTINQNLPNPGTKVDSGVLNALKIVFGLSEMYQVNFGEIRDGSLVVDLPAQIRVLFPLDEDSQVVLGALRLIYPKVSTGDFAGKYSEIDLRFRNPVLR